MIDDGVSDIEPVFTAMFLPISVAVLMRDERMKFVSKLMCEVTVESNTLPSELELNST